MSTQEPRPLQETSAAAAVEPATAAPASARKSLGRHLLVVLAGALVFALVGGLLAALLVHLQVNQADLLRWQAVSSTIKRWGLLLQCLVVAAVAVWWPAIVGWGHRRGVVKTHELAHVLRLRWAVLGFGVAYLLLVPIGPTTLWRYLMP